MEPDVVLTKIVGMLSFGEPTEIVIDSDGDSIDNGGWINVSIPVMLGETHIADADIGYWVFTNLNGCTSAETYDRIKRSGFAIVCYEGNERRLTYHVPGSLDGIFSLTAEEFDEISDWSVESAILDCAEMFCSVDPEEIFAEALRQRLAKTERDCTASLIDAVRALQGTDRS